MSHSGINPVLIEITRGALVESVHRGAVVVAATTGSPLLALGDTARPVFLRSAIKVVQALALVESGAADKLGFAAAEIALACGSHIGSDRHVAVGQSMLDRMQLDASCLACGAALPAAAKSILNLAASGRSPTPLHHTCSGKHIGLLAAAMGRGLPMADYTLPDHPVQRHVRKALVELTRQPLDAQSCAIDGCSVPTWALSLEVLARLFAAIASGTNMAPDRAAAMQRILAACWAEPELVAGPGRTDTVVMAALPGRVYLKTGAEGIYCGAIPGLGLGFALKVDDGAARASAGAVMPLVERLFPAARGLVKRGVLKTSQGVEVGTIRCSANYQRAIDALPI